MTLEPGIAALVATALIEWEAYRQCPTCRAVTGQPCRALSGRVAGGRPDGKATPLPRPHVARKLRIPR